MSIQTAGMILTMAGAGIYCYLSKQNLAISGVILVGGAFSGFIIGGYIDTKLHPGIAN